MIFDLSFLNLELEAAKTGVITSELLNHSAFQAIAAHEAELQRPVWDKESFETRFAAAAAGNTEKYSDWGLAPLFQTREKLEQMRNWLETEGGALTEQINSWLAHFTTVPQRKELNCVAYVGSYDAGFSLDIGSRAIYLNLSIFSDRESFLETLVHECYHARKVSQEAEQRSRQIENSGNPMAVLMWILAEEGTAHFVGYHGSVTTSHPVIPLRTPEEGTEELKRMLEQFGKGERSGADTLNAFLQTDCCYTAGGYIAQCVWEKFGREGLELWADKADLKAYYDAFRSTPWGNDWPELEVQAEKRPEQKAKQ